MQTITKKAFPIRDEADLHRALKLVESLWDAAPGSDDSELLEVVGVLIEDYESRQPALPPGDPIETIRFKLDELNWSQNDLARETGFSSGRISELLNRKRPLTLDHVRRISVTLGLPSGLLTHDTRTIDDGTVWVALPQDVADRTRSLAEKREVDVATLIASLVDDAPPQRSSLRVVRASHAVGCPTVSPAPSNLIHFFQPQPYERPRRGAA